jgi:ABC-2 type transport system ATP-binding protein
MSNACVIVENLVFDYGGTRALDRVSVAIERGSVTALVGPNGAGKTTLLRCMAGLEQPLAGNVRVDGVDAAKAPRAARRRVGFLQDYFGVYDALTVSQNLRHAAAVQGVAESDILAAAHMAATAVGLGDRLGQRAGALSRGLRQRLGIARAIVHQPVLLLLDEPASGLDPEARGALSGLLRSLNRVGMTIVVSSHILAELEEYSTQLLSMRDGKTTGPIAVGATAEQGRRLRLTVLGDRTGALAVLARHDGVSDVEAGSAGIVFRLAGGEAEQAALVQALLTGGVPVTGLAPVAATLDQLYRSGLAS